MQSKTDNYNAGRGITLARKNFDCLRFKGEFKVMNAEALEVPDGKFDAVYSFGVLHHTPNTVQAINEVYRVLKPVGSHWLIVAEKGLK